MKTTLSEQLAALRDSAASAAACYLVTTYLPVPDRPRIRRNAWSFKVMGFSVTNHGPILGVPEGATWSFDKSTCETLRADGTRITAAPAFDFDLPFDPKPATGTMSGFLDYFTTYIGDLEILARAADAPYIVKAGGIDHPLLCPSQADAVCAVVALSGYHTYIAAHQKGTERLYKSRDRDKLEQGLAAGAFAEMELPELPEPPIY